MKPVGQEFSGRSPCVAANSLNAVWCCVEVLCLISKTVGVFIVVFRAIHEIEPEDVFLAVVHRMEAVPVVRFVRQ
jgi:hypothetical protein